MQTLALGVLGLSIAAMVISAFLAIYAYKHDQEAGNLSFAYLQGVVTIWAGLAIIAYTAPAESGWVRGVYHLRTMVSLLAGVLAIRFIARYTRSSVLMSRAYRGALWGLYMVYVFLWLANPAELAYTDLTVQTYGSLTVVSPSLALGTILVVTLYYVLLTVAFGFLFRFGLDPSNIHRKQTLVIAGAFLIVTIGTIGTLLTAPGQQGLDMGILFQSLGGVVIALAIYRFEFLSVVSPARQAVVDEIDDPVIILDSNDTIAYTNPAAEAAGIDDTTIGSPIDEVAEGLTDAIQSGATYQFTSNGEFSMDGGSDRVFDPAESRVKDERGITSGRILLLRDITAQKRREQLLEQFAHSLSHDLRNPLTVAHGKAKLARDKGDLSYLDDALSAMKRMDELVDQLLEISQSGDAELDIRPVRLSTVAEDAWSAVSTGNATLNLVGADRSIFASYGHLQRVFENLFRNAIEHNNQPVTITVERTDAGFIVADDGKGIPPDLRDKIFERGYTRSDTGSGLGLDIVLQLTEFHGWDVSVDESADGGAKFVFET